MFVSKRKKNKCYLNNHDAMNGSLSWIKSFLYNFMVDNAISFQGKRKHCQGCSTKTSLVLLANFSSNEAAGGHCLKFTYSGTSYQGGDHK